MGSQVTTVVTGDLKSTPAKEHIQIPAKTAGLQPWFLEQDKFLQRKIELHRSPQRLRYSARVPSSKETPQINNQSQQSCVQHKYIYIHGLNVTNLPSFPETP